MPTLLIAAASALLLAAVVTEAVQRFFPDSYFALLVITFLALLINGLFNARLRQKPAVAEDSRRPTRTDDRSRNKTNQAQKREAGNRNGRGGKSRGEQKPRGDSGKPRKQNQPRQDSDAQPAAAAAAPDGPTETGTVKWFNRSKGYGFIIRDNGEEIFVHQRSIVRDDSRQRAVLRDGQKVSYVVSHQEKGAQAEHVQGLD